MSRSIHVLWLLATSCGGAEPIVADATIDSAISATCAEAPTHSDLAWIEDKVFKPSCVFSGCHNGSGLDPAGRLDLRVDQSHGDLVGLASALEPTRQLVVAGAPRRSYLLVMIGQIAPGEADPPTGPIKADVGTMPQGTAGALMCVEKRQAIERWIANGALN